MESTKRFGFNIWTYKIRQLFFTSYDSGHRRSHLWICEDIAAHVLEAWLTVPCVHCRRNFRFDCSDVVLKYLFPQHTERIKMALIGRRMAPTITMWLSYACHLIWKASDLLSECSWILFLCIRNIYSTTMRNLYCGNFQILSNGLSEISTSVQVCSWVVETM